MKLAAFTICVALSSHAAARGDQVLWNETTNGDFSGNRLAPTPLALGDGDNFLFGVMAGDLGNDTIDLDYFSVTVPVGFQLEELVLDFYASPDLVAFIGMQPGAVFPNDPATVGPDDLMGWTHMQVGQVGRDLFQDMATNGSGFMRPLPSGTYSFWTQQLDDYTDWTGRFVVTPVPAPSAGAVMLMLGGAGMRRRLIQNHGLC